VTVVAGPGARRELKLGRFRTSGEVHLWMYDRVSLGRSLLAAGFADAVVRGPGESGIADFADFGLEVVRGRVRKPESLYMEAVKPSPAS